MKIFNIFASILAIIFLISVLSNVAIAKAPPAVPDAPTPVPAAQPSGGSTSSYSAPSFQPYTVDLYSSDGTAIGSLAGIDYSTVRLNAAGHGIVNGEDHSVTIVADLSYKPASVTLDISLSPEGSLPDGMDNAVSLSSVVITGSSGLPLKSGTAKIRFAIPSLPAEAGQDVKYYVVYYDGTNYHFITASVDTGDGITTIEAAIPGITGTFTAIRSGGLAPAPVPTPTPGPVLTPSPSPEPDTPAQSGIMGWFSSVWISTFGTFAIGEAAGAVLLVLFGRFWK